MTNENKKNFLHHKPLTSAALEKLRQKGYKYVQVQGFTVDHHAEYTEPHYLMLVPIKDLPTDRAKMDIYEPIDSELINSWIGADPDENRLEIFLASSYN